MITWEKLDDELQSIIRNAGIPIIGAAEKHVIARGSTSSTAYQPDVYWRERVAGDRLHNTITAAHSGMTSMRNDVALLSPDSHSQAAGITWSKNMTHLLGMYGPAMFNMRSRIGHSADFATLLTVSGYGNTFANLYFMHGRGSATNLNLMTVSGNRNSFVSCHFGGPFNATEGGTSGYDLIRITGQENYFKGCVFGGDTIDQTTVTHLEFGSDSTRIVFEDCIFIMRATGANPVFMKLDAGGGNRHYIFRNCQFLNFGSSTLTLGITFDAATDATTARIFFDNRCQFAGIADVVKAAAESRVWLGLSAGSTTDTDFGMVTNPNVA